MLYTILEWCISIDQIFVICYNIIIYNYNV